MLPASAQATPPPAAADQDQVAERQNSPEALATAARNILELIEVHRFRMRRIDAALTYYRSIGDLDHVRQFSLLREREQTEYQQSLESYRRMLGEKDFLRVTGLLRDQLSNSAEHPEDDPTRVRARRDAAADTEASAAEIAERVLRQSAAQAAEERERASQQAAFERSQAIARARASQRVQLAQRLQQARADQLEQRAAAARRYQPPTLPGAPSASQRPVGAAPNGATPPPAARPAARPERP